MKKFGAKKIGALAIALALVTVGGVYATWTYNSSTSASATDNIYVTLAAATEQPLGAAGSYSIDFTTGDAKRLFTVDQYSFAKEELYDSTYNDDGIYDYIILYNPSTELVETYDYTSYNAASPLYSYDDYTAALCISHGAKVTVTFTADSTYATTTEYNTGIVTSFAFSWVSGSAPSVALSNTYPVASGAGADTTILTLDETTQYIYPTTETSAAKIWTAGGSGVFTYEISSALLCDYLEMAAYIVAGSYTQYGYLETALANCAIKLLVSESGTTLATPAISTATTGASGSITIGSVANASSYRIGLFASPDATSPTYYYDVTDVSNAISMSDLVTNTSAADGTYYIRIRALSATEDYANSVWSTCAYSLTISGSGTATNLAAYVNNSL